MSTEAVEGTGLPVSADAGIAETAVFGVSPGYFLRQIYPLDPAGGGHDSFRVVCEPSLMPVPTARLRRFSA